MRLNRRAFLASAAALPMAGAAPSVSALARDLTWVDATETASLIRRGEISAAEAVGAAIERARAVNPRLNFLVAPDFERAMTRAAQPNAPHNTGPFAGTPILIKDLNDVDGLVTRWGSRATAKFQPATRTEPRGGAVLAAGFNVIGKSATPEYGFLPTTEPLAFGPTRNPWDPERSSGGSSGGAASAVASGVLALSHATDGGGSIRIPAACCGLFGLKPSRARATGDRDGPKELTTSLCVSRTVRDTAGLLAAVEVRGDAAVGVVSGPSTRKLKIGFLTRDPLGQIADPEVVEAVESTALLLEDLGHDAAPMDRWPFEATTFSDDFLDVWAQFALLAALRIDEAAGPGTAAKVLEPFTLTLADRRHRLDGAAFEVSVGRLIAAARTYLAAFQTYDVIMSPVLSSVAPPIGFIGPEVEQALLMERLKKYVGYTPLNNVAGNPAMSVPLAWSADGLPIGVQFAADTGKERSLLELAYQLEAARPWAGKRPGVHA